MKNNDKLDGINITMPFSEYVKQKNKLTEAHQALDAIRVRSEIRYPLEPEYYLHRLHRIHDITKKAITSFKCEDE